jgi:hypothetical protein
VLGEIKRRECVLRVIKNCKHILRCEKTRNSLEELVDRRFTTNEHETGIKRTMRNKDCDKVQRWVTFKRV